jgi:hypothetical protein
MLPGVRNIRFHSSFAESNIAGSGGGGLLPLDHSAGSSDGTMLPPGTARA